jgi:hypothetical protein
VEELPPLRQGRLRCVTNATAQITEETGSLTKSPCYRVRGNGLNTCRFFHPT